MTVAPVVVKPEIASNRASVKESCKPSDSMKGREPKVLKTSQKSTVTTKPSRVLNSIVTERAGSQNSRPTISVIENAKTNIFFVPSSNKKATKTGVSIVRLKIINNRPKTRAMGAKCIFLNLKKGKTHSEKLLYGTRIGFVNHKNNNMVIVFNNRVSVSDVYFSVANKGRQCGPRW